MTDNMKLTKILVTFLAAILLMTLSSCQKTMGVYSGMTGIDASRVKPEAFAYDSRQSTSTSISVTWDAEKAIKDGATSFTVQLTTSPTAGGDNYDSSIAKTISAKDEQHEAVIFSGLKEYSRYYLRIRSNFPKSVYSEWEYLKQDGSLVQVSVGHGIVIMEFVAPTNVTVTPRTYSTADCVWGVVGPAVAYYSEYKKSADANWTPKDTTETSSAVLEGLDEQTNYDFRVKSIDENGNGSDWSTVCSFTTPEKPQFKPEIKTKDQLLEFFSSIAVQAGSSDSYYLANDIDLEGAAITSAESFAGNFDGKGFSIKKCAITAPLFGNNSGNISGLNIDSQCSLITDGPFAVIAATNTGTISKCVNKAGINISSPATLTILGTMALYNEGTIDLCENSGAITIGGSATAICVGGITAYTQGAVSNCKNSGKISISIADVNVMKEGGVYERVKKTVYPITGGICGLSYFGENTTIGFTNCTNAGEVSASFEAMSNRFYIAGICGTSIAGKIEDCTNSGIVSAKYGKGAATGTGKQIWLGGMTNGNVNEYKATGFGYPVIKGCTNKGDLTLNTDYTGGYNYVGGMCGAGDIETTGAFDNLVSNCVNEGNISAEGYGKIRAGGISGVAVKMQGNINRGTIAGDANLYAASQLGGMMGFVNGTGVHCVESCENYGNITYLGVGDVRCGGLFGEIGGTTGAGSIYSGNIVNATVSGAAGTTGVLVGKSSDKAYELGTAEAPNKVAGKVVGGGIEVTLDASNYMNYLSGNGFGSNPKVNVIFLQ